jgi:hypothetical protein
MCDWGQRNYREQWHDEDLVTPLGVNPDWEFHSMAAFAAAVDAYSRPESRTHLGTDSFIRADSAPEQLSVLPHCRPYGTAGTASHGAQGVRGLSPLRPTRCQIHNVCSGRGTLLVSDRLGQVRFLIQTLRLVPPGPPAASDREQATSGSLLWHA